MAGEWIKVQNVTPNKPEVFVISDSLGIDPDAVVGKLVRVWVWADEQTTDGYAPSVTKSLLDRIAGVAGFADAMLKSGWLTADGAKFAFPNFDRHNGETSKTRALASKRMQRHRSKKSDGVGVTQAQPEKRREEKNKDVSNDTSGRVVSLTELQAVVDEWNLLGITNCSKLTNKRRTGLVNRLRDDDWREKWRMAIDRVRESPFCHGDSDSGWKADFDWFIRPDTVTKILEGKYDERTGNGGEVAGRGHRESSAEARQRSNLSAIEKFVRRGTVRESDAGADGAEANRRLH